MSATTVLHTSICFMILYAKKKILFPKKGYSMWTYPYSLFSGSFYSGSSPYPDSFSMFLIFTNWPCLTDVKYACLFLFRICAQHIENEFPLLIQELFMPTKGFLQGHSRVTDRIPKFHLFLTCLIEVNYHWGLEGDIKLLFCAGIVSISLEVV